MSTLGVLGTINSWWIKDSLLSPVHVSCVLIKSLCSWFLSAVFMSPVIKHLWVSCTRIQRGSFTDTSGGTGHPLQLCEVRRSPAVHLLTLVPFTLKFSVDGTLFVYACSVMAVEKWASIRNERSWSFSALNIEIPNSEHEAEGDN